MSHIRRIWFVVATLALSAISLTLVPVKTVAQDPATGDVKDHGGRKVKASVKPAYPDIARQMHITGTVRLEATVAPPRERMKPAPGIAGVMEHTVTYDEVERLVRER